MSLRAAIAAHPSATGLASTSGCIVVGEVAQAHDGSLGLAHAFIDAIADAGADAVKFQTHIAAAESTPAEEWRVRFSLQDRNRYEYWRRMEFTEDQWRSLKQHAEQLGLLFVSSPFSTEAVELLDRLGVAVWKIASGETSNELLIDAVLQRRQPVLLSSGMSPLAELDTAVARVAARGVPFAVMQCTSEYPCPPERVGLNLIRAFQERYASFVGLSDHSGTIFPGLAAAAAGIDVLEVHVTLSRQMFGPDVGASLTPEELRTLVAGIRFIESMAAHPVDKDMVSTELGTVRRLFTKSVVAVQDLPAGTVLRREHLAVKKPGTGLPVDRLPTLVGARLRRAVRADERILQADLEEVI
jgi:N,N'-diacetyllegionaminate synthase